MRGHGVKGYFYQKVDSAGMKSRVIAAAFVIVMMASCIVPIAETDGADTGPLDPTQFKITIPSNFDHMASTIMENGQSRTFYVYITNFSEHVLDVQFTIDTNSPSYLSYDQIEGVTLMPAGDMQGRDFIKIGFNIHVKEVTGSHRGGQIYLVAHVADVETEAFTLVPLTFKVDVNSNFDASGSYNRFFGIINNTLPEPFNTPYVPFIVTFIGFIVLALIAVKIIIPFIIKYVDDNKERTKKILSLAVLIMAIVLFIDPGLRILGADLDLILQVRKASFAILIVVLAIAIWKIYMIVVESMLNRVGLNKDSPIDLTFLPLFSMVGKFVLWIGGVAAILHVYGFDLTGILISAGIVTLGITMGAQSVLSQLFNGISLLLTRPFNEGDCLQIAGETYIVKHVKLMYTEFTSLDNDRIITIPNDAVASATIVNMSKYDAAYRMNITFQIPYGVEVEKVEKILLDMAEESKHVLHDYDKYRKPSVRLMDFKDSGILMRLDVTVVNFFNSQAIMSDMKKELYYRLSEQGIEMPYNRLEVSIIENEPDKATTV